MPVDELSGSQICFRFGMIGSDWQSFFVFKKYRQRVLAIDRRYDINIIVRKVTITVRICVDRMIVSSDHLS